MRRCIELYELYSQQEELHLYVQLAPELPDGQKRNLKHVISSVVFNETAQLQPGLSKLVFGRCWLVLVLRGTVLECCSSTQ